MASQAQPGIKCIDVWTSAFAPLGLPSDQR